MIRQIFQFHFPGNNRKNKWKDRTVQNLTPLVDVNKNTPIHSTYKYFLTFDVTKTRRNIFKIKNAQT